MAQAIQMFEYGSPKVLKYVDMNLPELDEDEVRFRVLAAPLNRADIEIRSGKWPIMRENPFPYTPGLEAVGEVTQCGNAVRSIKVKDTVITMMQKLGGIHGIRPGGYQEFVTVKMNTLAVIPHNLNPLDVSALGLAAVTAYNGINRLSLKKGNMLLITGASGGVGSAAIQIARVLGLKIIATTYGEDKVQYLQEIGADQVINLKTGKLIEQVAPSTLDAVLDTLGQSTFADCVALLKRGGRLCCVGAASGAMLNFSAWDLLQDLQITGYSSENLTGESLKSEIGQLCEWLSQGKLQVPAYRCFPLCDASIAHELMESNLLSGRALLIP